MTDLAPLLAVLDAHHITDRALLAARDRARRDGDAAAARTLRREMTRYFGAVVREAGGQLARIDGRLDELYQRQYNLQAERGVLERRLAAAVAAVALAERDGTGTPS